MNKQTASTTHDIFKQRKPVDLICHLINIKGNTLQRQRDCHKYIHQYLLELTIECIGKWIAPFDVPVSTRDIVEQVVREQRAQMIRTQSTQPTLPDSYIDVLDEIMQMVAFVTFPDFDIIIVADTRERYQAAMQEMKQELERRV